MKNQVLKKNELSFVTALRKLCPIYQRLRKIFLNSKQILKREAKVGSDVYSLEDNEKNMFYRVL